MKNTTRNIEASSPRLKVVQYSFICWRLSRRGLSQSLVARTIGCSPEVLNGVIKGTKQSGNIQKKLALILGYRDWSEMMLDAYYWDQMVHESDVKRLEQIGREALA